MDCRKIGKALLFPPIAIMIVLLPVAAVLLVYSMVFIGTESVIAMTSYVLAAYTLTVWCMKIPRLIRFFKTFREENRYTRRWLEDTRLRVNVSLYGSLIWNTAYAVFQLGLGFWHHSFWFFLWQVTIFLLRLCAFSWSGTPANTCPAKKCERNLSNTVPAESYFSL